MGPDTHLPAPAPAPEATRCPHCGGAVRADAPWCTQCWTDLRPAPEPAVTVPTAAPAPVTATTAPVGDAGAASAKRGLGGWPCSGCGATNAVELDSCAACGTGFLAGLRRDEPPLLALPGVGDVTRLSRAQRLGLAGGVVVLFVLLTALVGLLTG